MSDKRIEVIARGVCVVRGHLLCCQRSKKATNCYLPGGHVEFGEPADVALKREILEEMGRHAHVGRFLGCCEHAFLQKGQPHAEINLIFLMTLSGVRSVRPLASRESWISFDWLPLKTLQASALEPAPLRRRIPLWLKSAPGFVTSGNAWGV